MDSCRGLFPDHSDCGMLDLIHNAKQARFQFDGRSFIHRPSASYSWWNNTGELFIYQNIIFIDGNLYQTYFIL